MFANLVWPSKLANIPPCYVFLIQIINGNCIFSHSLAKLANTPQEEKVGKRTPPQIWGASVVPLIFIASVSALFICGTLGLYSLCIRSLYSRSPPPSAVPLIFIASVSVLSLSFFVRILR